MKMNTATLEILEKHLVEIKMRTEEAYELLTAGIYDRSIGGIERSGERIAIGHNVLGSYDSEKSVAELADRVLTLVQSELSRREDRLAWADEVRGSPI